MQIVGGDGTRSVRRHVDLDVMREQDLPDLVILEERGFLGTHLTAQRDGRHEWQQHVSRRHQHDDGGDRDNDRWQEGTQEPPWWFGEDA
jgi:hypothetical protein